MVDPLSIAGVAIAVLDHIINLSIWTASVIQDARTFDEWPHRSGLTREEQDTRRLQTLIASDVSRNTLLKKLLFAQATAYGGNTLFEQFDHDVQEQTLALLEESKDILQAGHNLLQRRYGSVDAFHDGATTPSTLSPPTSMTAMARARSHSPKRRKPNAPVFTILRFAIIDKKRVEEIIKKFNEHNQRLQDNVKLWCLADQLGVDFIHLKHLQNDQVSKDLGFNLDATLQLTSGLDELPKESLELPSTTWKLLLANSAALPHCPSFRTIRHGSDIYLVEQYRIEVSEQWLRTSQSLADQVEPATKIRIEALTRLLHEPKEPEFLVPHCLGWSYTAQERCVSLVFPVPSTPINLLKLLSGSGNTAPGLGEKFRLAAGLAACVAQLHMVGWLHESFRSANVLFFPQSDVDPSVRENIDLTIPAVLGFEYSRPNEVRSARMDSDYDPDRDLYLHPERLGIYPLTFTKLHDIYALGVVLLEIGLWEPAVALQKDRFKEARLSDRYVITSQLLSHAEHRLEKRVGKRYKEVVLKCLKGDFGVLSDNKQNLKLQQAFRSQIVDVLVKAADAV